jgi:hypothetical protein
MTTQPRRLQAAGTECPATCSYMPLDSEHVAWMFADPENFIHDSFTSATADGVRTISGTLRDGGETAVCSYCFDRDKFTPLQAEQWVQANKINAVRFEWSKMDAYRNVTAKLPRTLRHSAGAARIRAEAKIPTYDGQAYDGGPMLPEGFTIPVVVDVNGLELPATVKTFKGHDVDNEVGHGPAAKRAGTLQCSGVISGKGQAAREVVDAAKDGFPWELSITADVIGEPEYVPQGKTITANGRNFSGPLVYWRRSQLQEISFVGKGASAHTHVSIAAKAAKPPRSPKMDELFVQWLADHGHEDPSAIKPEALTRLQAKWGDENRAQQRQTTLVEQLDAEKKQIRASLAGEHSRLRSIESAYDSVCRRWSHEDQEHTTIRGKAADLRQKAIDDNWSADKCELEFLRLGYPQKAMQTHSQDSGDVQPKVLLAAACRASMMPEETLAKNFDAQTREMADRFYPTMGLKRLLAAMAGPRFGNRPIYSDDDIRECLYYAFPKWEPGQQSRRLQAEFSSLSLPGIMSNLANKWMYDGFFYVEDVWRLIGTSRPVSDFKPHMSFSFYGDLTYEKVGPSGEIRHGSVGEIQYVNQAQTYAKMFVTTRQDIRNDDLGALTRLPQMMGMGAADALNLVFWTKFLSGVRTTPGITGGGNGDAVPVATPGTETFWSTAHKNYLSGSGTALAVTSLTKAKQAFLEQLKPGQTKRPIGIKPRVLLTPPALEDTAKQIINSEYVYEAVLGLASTSSGSTERIGTTNPHKGLFQQATSAYLASSVGLSGASDTAWWLMADPVVVPTIEIAWLDGQQTPTVQSTEADFDILGMAHRGFFDFGVEFAEYRNSVMSAGNG